MVGLDKLPWQEVESSQIYRIAHDGTDMIVQFREGDGTPGPFYKYEEVPRDRYQRILDATSPGSMLGKLVKGKFQYERLESDGETDELGELRRRVEVLEADMQNMKRAMRALLNPTTRPAA